MIDEMAVMSHLLGFYPDGIFKSPFRDDKHPRCRVANKLGYLRYYDGGDPLRNGKNVFDLWALVKWGRPIGFGEYSRVLFEIGACGLGYGFSPSSFERNKPKIRFTPGPLLPYYSDYFITEEDLKEDGVYGVIDYTVNSGNGWIKRTPEDPCFCYTYKSGNRKIYRPNRTDNMKWYANTNENDIHFEDEGSGGDLFICTSYKDARATKNCGFNVRGLQSETAIPDEVILSRWKTRFNPYFLADIDGGGLNNATFFFEKTGITPIYMPMSLIRDKGIKDIAEFIKRFGREEARSLINTIKYRL